jgi:amino acid adenylation domain-containing protein
MNLVELLDSLVKQNVRFWVEDDRLKYRAPRGALTSDILNILSENREEIITILKQQSGKAFLSYPLSYGQKAMWFLYQTAPESAAYNVVYALRVRSRINIPSFRLTFQELIDRHPILRTTYSASNGVPFQQIHIDMQLDFEEINTIALTTDELNEQIELARKLPFNLEQGPVMRVKLFTRSSDDYVLLVIIHHIATDGWSMQLLIDELKILYLSKESAAKLSLPRPDTNYTDFIDWQTNMLKGPIGERLWSYWRKQFEGELPVLNLPTDRPRTAVQTFRGDTYRFGIKQKITCQLKELSSVQGATLYMVLLAAFQGMLYRYTGQEDIVVGSPTFGRTSGEFKSTLGYFVNPVVLRADLSGDPTFKEFLVQVRHTLIMALEHADFPFPLLVERLQPTRDPSRSPIFQVEFNFLMQNQVPNTVGAPFTAGTGLLTSSDGLCLEPIYVRQQEGQFDLTLEIEEFGETLSAILYFNTDLFDRTTISRMAGHYEKMLEGIVRNPDNHISNLPLLTESELHKFVEWNASQREYPKNKTLVQLFEEQVRQSPDAVAVEYEGSRLSYFELNSRANQLAHHLMTLGVGPEVMVGLYMERSLEMVIGIYGIIKAGGAYVPLDPEYPPDRIVFMIEDTDVPVLLTQQHLIASLPEQRAIVICLDSEWNAFSGENTENPDGLALPENMAYVIYTSGSTGLPKGVINEHCGIVNRLIWMQDEFQLTVADRVLQKTPFSFDVSVWEFFWPLQVGASLVLAKPGGHKDSAYLIKLIIDRGITTLHFVPSMLNVFIEGEDVTQCACIKRVICSGETLPFDLQKRFYARLNTKLYNLYGPTEAAVDVSCWACQPNSERSVVPIGFPIANTQLYILAHNMSLMPIGCAGELHIGGIQVARGYLNRPELTAEKFIPDPFDEDPKARLYKTGDLARYLPDGSIEYLGRIDSQVKLRGLRVELGEIETRLMEVDSVKKCVVVVREDRPGDQKLVAYYVVKESHVVSASELRGYLRTKLPDYMVPQLFLEIASIPLTPNGKVNRLELPAPDDARPELEHVFEAPRTQQEELLSGIWAEVLGIEKVGIHDNFFELGGHSLLATQVISRIREAFQVELPLASLFEAPEIEGLCEKIDRARQSGRRVALPKIESLEESSANPLSFAQERMWFVEQLLPDSPVNSIPLALSLEGPLDREALTRTLNEIVRRQSALRTVFENRNGSPFQVVMHFEPFEVPVVDLSGIDRAGHHKESQRIILDESEKPFSIDNGPLFRFLLIKQQEFDHILIISLHHMISDGWSIGVLFREISHLYRAIVTGREAELPKLPVTYTDITNWQRRLLEGGYLDDQIAYWKSNMAGELMPLQLPAVHARVSQSFDGKIFPFTFSDELSTGVRRLCRMENVTPFMAFLAGFKVLLSRYTSCNDVIVGSPIANRNYSEIEPLIGLFMNPMPFRTNLSGNPSFRELLSRVRETAINAYQHQDVPFNTLVRVLQEDRELDRMPFFQHMLIYQDFALTSLDLPQIKSRIIMEFDRTTTLGMDVILHVWESDGTFKGILEYRADIFEEDRAASMIVHLENIIRGAIEDPERRLKELPLLDSDEYFKLIFEWNQRTLVKQEERCVYKIIEDQAAAVPNAIAITSEQGTMTYWELDQRSNQLARYLRTVGAKPGMLVGVCLERTMELIVCLLAVLKSGAAYLPLDPTYPLDRLSYILSDARADILLTTDDLRMILQSTHKKTVTLDGDRKLIELERKDSLGIDNNPLDLAYVIYTSGSTGQPKGVMIEHRSLTNAYFAWEASYTLQSVRSHLQMASFSFDVFSGDVVRALCSGGKLVLCPRDYLMDPERLYNLMCKEQVDFAEFVPVVLRELINFLENNEKRFDFIRILVCGSDSWNMGEFRKCMRFCGPQSRVINSYGVTEATIDSSYFENATLDISSDQLVPIGRPFANIQLYVLDQNLMPTPVGVPGELHIGGIGLARGYLNRPDLTAEKFITNPFSGEPSERLYKTGDQARYRPDGNIELLGRVDFQIKIRGFRVEIGEIESVLGQHPAVRQNAVTSIEDSPGNKRLVAYVVAHNHLTPLAIDMRNFLKEKLPDYMLPSTFVLIDALPLTPNGKIDHRALPSPEPLRPELEADFVEPRNEIERTIASIWHEVLKLEKVGIHHNFFDLGGHSLLTTQLHSRLRDQFAVNLPLRNLFEATTVAEQGQLIATLLWASQNKEHDGKSSFASRQVIDI